MKITISVFKDFVKRDYDFLVKAPKSCINYPPAFHCTKPACQHFTVEVIFRCVQDPFVAGLLLSPLVQHSKGSGCCSVASTALVQLYNTLALRSAGKGANPWVIPSSQLPKHKPQRLQIPLLLRLTLKHYTKQPQQRTKGKPRISSQLWNFLTST